MNKTQPVEWIKQPFEGYVMNTLFSGENTAEVMKLVDAIDAEYGDSVFCMPENALHITLLDCIAPLVDYDGKNKKQLFETIYDGYDKAFCEILGAENKFKVTFDKIHVAPTTIFISGHDNGEFERIRSKYIDSVDLLPNTKLPPKIIHSSLARFTGKLGLDEVKAFIEEQSISVEQPINEFRLVHSFREPMLEFEVLKTYPLG